MDHGKQAALKITFSLLTLALSLVLHVQVRVAFTFSLQQCAFVFVGLAIRAADRSFPGDVGAVWCAHAAWLTSSVHLAPLSRPTVNVIAGFYNERSELGGASDDVRLVRIFILVHTQHTQE